MKPTKFNPLVAAFVFFGAVSSSYAIDVVKENNTTAMNSASSWVGGALPGSTDNLVFNSTVDATTALTTLAFGNGQFLGGITVTNPGGNITTRVSSNGTTTWANNALIDMSAATVDFNWSSGTMRVASANFNPTLTVASGRTLTIGGGGINNQGNTKTLTMAGSGNIIYNVASGGGGAMNFNITGANVTMNAANNSWTAGTVTSGKLTLGNTDALTGKTLTVNAASGLGFGTGITSANLGGLAGSGDFALTNADTSAVNLSVGSSNGSQTYSGSLSGGGSLTKTGSGTLTLSGSASNFTGGIALNAGAITFGNSNAAAGGTITAADTTSINLANSSSVFLGGTVATSGTNANVTLTSGNISAGFSTAFTGSSGQTLTISGSNQVNLASSSQQLSGFGGTVAVASGATLRFSSSSLNNGGDNTTFDLTGSMVTRNSGYLALGALSGSGNISMGGSGSNNAALNLTIGAKNLDSSYSGAISDSDAINGKIVNITKTGSGTQTFAGTSTYTGATTVSAGTLLVNGSLGDTAVAVNNGGTLGGSNGVIGTTTATVSVNDGGTLAAGNSPGTLTVNGSTTFNSGSTYAYQYTGGDTTADLLDVNGTLTINSGALLTLEELGIYTLGDKFTLFAYESLVGGFDAYADGQTYSFNGGSWAFNYFDTTAGLNGGTITGDAGSGFVTITAVIPEPSTALLGGLGVLCLLRRRRNG